MSLGFTHTVYTANWFHKYQKWVLSLESVEEVIFDKKAL